MTEFRCGVKCIVFFWLTWIGLGAGIAAVAATYLGESGWEGIGFLSLYGSGVSAVLSYYFREADKKRFAREQPRR